MPHIARFLRDRRGSITVEAAIIIPVVIFILILGMDVVRYVEASARAHRAAAVAADLTARNETVRDNVDFNAAFANNDLAAFFTAANEVAWPDDLVGWGRVYIGVFEPSSGAELWQRTGPYALDAESRVDNLPPLPANGGVVVAEVFLDFQPMLLDAAGFSGLADFVIYRRAFFRPRLAALATLERAD